jgi:hypothetical protein
VAKAKNDWRAGHHRGRRPGVWPPGETLIIDWGSQLTFRTSRKPFTSPTPQP